MENNLVEYLVILQLGAAGFLLGWAMPRGKYLKSVQLRVLRWMIKFFR